MVQNAASAVKIAVGKEEKAHSESSVINGHLVENALRETDCRSFEFDEAKRLQSGVIDDGITTFGDFADRDGGFNGNERLRITEIFNECVQKMLPNPLFGRETDVFPPP